MVSIIDNNKPDRVLQFGDKVDRKIVSFLLDAVEGFILKLKINVCGCLFLKS